MLHLISVLIFLSYIIGKYDLLYHLTTLDSATVSAWLVDQYVLFCQLWDRSELSSKTEYNPDHIVLLGDHIVTPHYKYMLKYYKPTLKRLQSITGIQSDKLKYINIPKLDTLTVNDDDYIDPISIADMTQTNN